MASDLEFVQYVCEQAGGAGDITYIKMFGEYGIYCDSKIIGLVCGNQFFLKITEGGRALLPGAQEGPAYPGSKPYFIIDSLDDAKTVAAAVRATYDELPMPKPKKKKRRL